MSSDTEGILIPPLLFRRAASTLTEGTLTSTPSPVSVPTVSPFAFPTPSSLASDDSLASSAYFDARSSYSMASSQAALNGSAPSNGGVTGLGAYPSGLGGSRGTPLLSHIFTITCDPAAACKPLRELAADPKAMAAYGDDAAGVSMLLGLAERLAKAESDVSTPGTDHDWPERRPQYNILPTPSSNLNWVSTSSAKRPSLSRTASMRAEVSAMALTSRHRADSESDSGPLGTPRHSKSADFGRRDPVSPTQRGFYNFTTSESDGEGPQQTYFPSEHSHDDEATQLLQLKASIRAIARVVRSLRNGDLDPIVHEEMYSPDLASLKSDLNSLVRRLRRFAHQVATVTQRVGIRGELGHQADLQNSVGIWRTLLVNVNNLASNLSAQVRDITDVTTAVAKGDFTRTIEVAAEGEILTAKNTVNNMVTQLNTFATEVARIAQMVGTDGILDQQITVHGVQGVWRDLTDNVNVMARNLTLQVRGISAVTSAIARGDFSQRIEVEAKGETADLKKTVNTMVDQLAVICEQVSNVAREVGTEGNLGGQAIVPNVEGAWADLTNNVNQMARNLTDQVRQIAEVTKAVAKGDLGQQITVDARGEVAELAQTVNNMVGFLRVFAAEVTRVSLMTGTEGSLGVKAEVAGVSGEWKTLVDRVNTMAGNLTTQVREIARVTTAVANGDLTSYVEVDARGEIGELRDTVNAMVKFLQDFASEVTRVATNVGTCGKLGDKANVQNANGEWSNLVTGFNRMVDRVTVQVRAISGSTTAVAKGNLDVRVEIDAEGEILELANTINNMLNKLKLFTQEVVRIAQEIVDGNLNVRAEVHAVEGVWSYIVTEVNRMSNTLRTQVSQFQMITDAAARGDFASMTDITEGGDDIRARGDIKALQSNINTMVVKLRAAFEQTVRAKESAEAHSTAKTQFLANTSHEIRTPLNAIIGLTLDTLMTTLNRTQRENLNLVRGQADALLRIINDILDITKIEVGRLTLDKTSFSIREIVFEALTSLAFGAGQKNLDVLLQIEPEVPDLVVGDGSRLAQVIKNLVGNAQKFTQSGSITLTAKLSDKPVGSEGKWRVEFHVIDTGIGIKQEHARQRIFESFMQADGSVTRKYGGTGLGLSISRNLVEQMGGSLDVKSEVDVGSDFSFDAVLFEADEEAELPRQIEKLESDQCVLIVDGQDSDRVADACREFGLGVVQVGSVAEVPAGDDFDCAVVSSIAQADALRSSRFLPLVFRAPQIPSLNMRKALDFSLASVIENDKGKTELCNALHRALVKSMRKVSSKEIKADWRVLLAEDNRINQVVASRILTNHGLSHIKIVDNGEKAVEEVKNQQFDIVLMDVSMPIKDGREATQDIRKWEKEFSAHPIPIIGVTAHALVGDHEKCMEAGMTGVCTKPLMAPELLATMSKAIIQYRQFTSTERVKKQ